MARGITLQQFNEWLVYLTISILPLYIFRFSILGVRSNILEVVIVINFLITLYSKYKEKRLFDFKTSFTYPILFLLLSAIISVLVSDFSRESLGIFKGWFLIPIMFYFNYHLNIEKNKIAASLLYLMIPVFIVSLMAIMQKTGLITTIFYQRGDYTFSEYIYQGRAFSLFESPNFLAMFLVPLLFLLFGVKDVVKKKYKVLYWLFFILPLLAIYFSDSRAGLLALVLGALFFTILFYWKDQVKNFKVFIPAFIVAFFMVLNISYLYFATEAYSTSRGGDNIRIEIYNYALDILKNNWLIGVGLGQFQEKVILLSFNNPSFQYSGLSYALHPHNLFLAIWLNLGLLGILSFLSILYLILKKVVANINLFSLSILAALIAIMVHGLFDTTYFKNDLSVLFWLIPAIVLTMYPDEKQASKN